MLYFRCMHRTNERPLHGASRVALVLVACAGLACAEEERTYQTCLDPDIKKTEPPDVPLVHQTEHLDIHVDDGGFVCAGTALDYERFIRYVADELDLEIERRISLYMVENPHDYCPSPLGCTKADGTAFAVPSATHHELTHAVACEIRVHSAPALTEGLATGFEPTGTDSKYDPRSFLTLPRPEINPYYQDAGHFVRWLLEEIGPAAFKRIYQMAPAAAGDGVVRALEDTLGESLDDLSEDYLAHAPENWMPTRQCDDLAVLPSNGSSWVFEGHFDCDEESTLGPYERMDPIFVDLLGAFMMYQSFLIDVETPGPYHVESIGAMDMYFEKCMESGDQPWNPRILPLGIVDYGTLELDSAGLWRIDVLVPHGPATDVSITITPEA